MKSEVIVSSEFKPNVAAPLIAWNKETLGDFTGVAEPEADPEYTNPAPPLPALAPKANGLSKIVPISGSNQP